ncbi:MAG: hypothetical protein HEP71_02010 [Roseivirga sp.]|nr:hypothetical protein [Roseivirga sp.]
MRETITPTKLQRERRASRPVLEKPKSKLEQYLKYAPLAYLYLIVYSYVGLDTYYSEFGIEILGYMSVQEMLVLPLENISGVLINVGVTLSYLIVMILFHYFTFELLALIFRLFGKRTLKSEMLKIEERFPMKDSFFDLLITLTIIVSLSSSHPVFEFGFFGIYQGVSKLIFNYFLIGIPLQLVVMIWWDLNSKSFNNFDQYYLNRKPAFRLAFIICLFIYVNYLFMLNRAEDLIHKKPNQVKLEIKDQKETSKQALLLGTTNSTVFLYDTAKEESFVIPKSEIRELRYLKDKPEETPGKDSVSMAKPDTRQLIPQDALNNPPQP